MATLYGVNAGGNWDAGGTWSTTATKDASRTGGASAPTAADNCILDDYSGSVTNTGFGVCRSLDCTGYTGTLTLNASQELRFGDATGGPSNKTLVLVAGMTLTAAASSIMGFVTGSGSVQTINFASKTTGNVTFNATGSYQLLSGFTCPATSTVTLTKGTLDINGQTCSWGLFSSSNTNTRSLTLGAAAITLTGTGTPWAMNDCSNMTLSAGSSTITLSGGSAGFSSGATGGTTKTFGTVIFTGSAIAILSGANTFGNITRTGTAAKTDSFQINGDNTITGTFTCNGNSTINRLLVFSNTVGTARTITAATWSVTNTDFQDIIGAGAGSRDFSAQTDVGDCGGNSGITFPASVNRVCTMSTSKNWSDTTIWTGGIVPLPQDNMSGSGITGGTLTSDMPRLAANIDFTGATGTPAWANGVAQSMYGSLTLISGMTISGTNTLTLAGRGNYTITSAGKTFTQGLTFACPTGTYNLQDALNTAGVLTFSNGVFNTNSFGLTFSTIVANFSTTRSVLLGTSTLNCTTTAVANVVNFGTTTALTFSGENSTFVIVNASANLRNFINGLGLLWGTLTYTVAGSTGTMGIITGGSFAVINFSDVTNARLLNFTAGITVTIRNGNGFNVRGTAGKLMTIDTITGASTFTLTSPNQQSTDYITPTRSTVDASPKWYAGANSTDGTGNTNWVFSAAPLISSSRGMFSKSTQSLQNLCRL